MASSILDQIKIMLKSASITLTKHITKAQATADNAQAAANEAKGTANNAFDAVEKKMNENNPQGAGYFVMNKDVFGANKTPGRGSHSINGAFATGDYASAGGFWCTASGYAAHAEGKECIASGIASCAKGYRTLAEGDYSNAEGASCKAYGDISYAQGDDTIAQYSNQFVIGRMNDPGPVIGLVDNKTAYGKYVFIVGNGSHHSETTPQLRKNAHTLDWDGNAWYAGAVEGTAFILKSATEGSTKRFKVTVDDSGTLSATEITE